MLNWNYEETLKELKQIKKQKTETSLWGILVWSQFVEAQQGWSKIYAAKKTEIWLYKNSNSEELYKMRKDHDRREFVIAILYYHMEEWKEMKG